MATIPPSADAVIPPEPPPLLQAPTMLRSTRIARHVIVSVSVFTLLSFWLPAPSGIVATLLMILVVVPLSITVVSDLGVLRREREEFAKMAVSTPADDAGAPRVLLDLSAMCALHLARWRKWRPWLAAIAVVAVGIAAFAPSGLLGLGLFVLAIAAARDAFLGLQVGEALPRDVRATLPWFERTWLGAYTGALGAVFVLAALSIFAFIGYLFLGPVPLRWNSFAFTAVWGWFAVFALPFGWRLLRAALWHRDADDAPSRVEVQVVSDIDDLPRTGA